MGILGKIFTTDLSSSATRFRTKYLMGHPLLEKPVDIFLVIQNDGVELGKVWSPVFRKTGKIKIPWELVSKISAETQGQISKRVSVGRTAVGLFLFGLPGAIIGAGLRKKEDNRQMFVSIEYKDDTGLENTLVLQSPSAYQIATKMTSVRYKHISTQQNQSSETQVG